MTSLREKLQRTGNCVEPDRDVPKLLCGYPLPCPHHPVKSMIQPHPQNPNFPASYEGPKSTCVCGHAGDGSGSEHGPSDHGVPGHGKCNDRNCPCEKFRWSGYTKEYAAVLAELRSRQGRT